MGGFEEGGGSCGEGSGHYNSIGWGALLCHLNTSDIAAKKAANSSFKSNPSINSTTTNISKQFCVYSLPFYHQRSDQCRLCSFNPNRYN